MNIIGLTIINYMYRFIYIVIYIVSIHSSNCYLYKNKQGRTHFESALAAVNRKLFAKTES